MAEEDLLGTLLQVAEEIQKESQPKNKLILTEADLFGEEFDNIVDEPEVIKTSLIHNGDTDSSDDEDNKYYEESKYNECGRELKQLLTSTLSTLTTSSTASNWKTAASKPLQLQTLSVTQTKPVIQKYQDVYTDPIFGLRIVNPLISSTLMQERMVGREAVSFCQLKKFVSGTNITDKNWVIAGVISNKSSVRTSQKGNQFLIWTLTDLKNDIKTVSVFLFRSAYKELWKTSIGTVVSILKPSILDKKDGSRDEACLSVDNFQRVMILGQSKDLGTCKSLKKTGEKCTVIVNTYRCEFCIYHIKQEYQKCSKRSELQSNFAGKGLHALRNKVLGKNEVFYAGKSYTAIPAKHNRTLETKDKHRLNALNGLDSPSVSIASRAKSSIYKKGAAVNLEISRNQRLRDLELLEKLGTSKSDFSPGHSSEVTLDSSRSTAVNVIAKLKRTQTQKSLTESVRLGGDNAIENNSSITKDTPLLLLPTKDTIDLNSTISSKQVERAKLNALKYIQRNGPLQKSDPNSVKSPTAGKKRLINEHLDKREAKKPKLSETNEFRTDRFKKMMATTSKHSDLLDKHENEEQEKYFNKLEIKEKMEVKMANTFKVVCKAVRCLTCKYVNFSAAQLCKDQKHELKVYDAVKRFFKCENCSNRTVCLEIVPVSACSKCGSGKWTKTGMMAEKVAKINHELSIRGGEQKFTNSVATNDNLNLLVPDE